MRLKSKDIAEILNISPAAVSLAINNKPGVSNETRNKVNSLIEEYYRTGRLTVIEEDEKTTPRNSLVLVIHKKQKGMIIPSQFFLQIIENIQSGAMDGGYNLEILYYNPNVDNKTYIDGLNDDRIDGVLLFATEMSYEDLEIYLDVKKPMVVLDSRFAIEGLDMVTLNNRHGLMRAVKHAYACGHREIGYLKSKIEINNFQDRFEGYLQGLKAVGLPFNQDFVFHVDPMMEDAYQDFLKILEKPDIKLPSILVTELDYIIIGALRALKEKGYRVPEQISLIGFDDYEVCTQMDPPITTIKVDQCIGTVAINRLMEKIDKGTPYVLNIEVDTKLVERSTVKMIKD